MWRLAVTFLLIRKQEILINLDSSFLDSDDPPYILALARQGLSTRRGDSELSGVWESLPARCSKVLGMPSEGVQTRCGRNSNCGRLFVLCHWCFPRRHRRHQARLVPKAGPRLAGFRRPVHDFRQISRRLKGWLSQPKYLNSPFALQSKAVALQF